MKMCYRCGTPFIPGIFYTCPVDGQLKCVGDVCQFEGKETGKEVIDLKEEKADEVLKMS